MLLVAKFIIPFLLGNAYSVARNTLDKDVTVPGDKFPGENKNLPSEMAMHRNDLSLEYNRNENSTKHRMYLGYE